MERTDRSLSKICNSLTSIIDSEKDFSPAKTYQDISSIETRKMDFTTVRSTEEMTQTLTHKKSGRQLVQVQKM